MNERTNDTSYGIFRCHGSTYCLLLQSIHLYNVQIDFVRSTDERLGFKQTIHLYNVQIDLVRSTDERLGLKTKHAKA